MSAHKRSLVASIEAGGTHCQIVLANKGGVVARTTAGTGNYTSLGLERTLERLKSATEDALRQLPSDLRPSRSCSLPLEEPMFAALSVGMAGLDRQSDVEAITPHLARLFSLDPSDPLAFIVGNDATLLSVPMIADHDARAGVAIVSGTGSVGFSYTKTPAGLPTFHQRAGGYGHLLGDEGSGYYVGKQAIVAALSAFDANQPYTPFQHAVYRHFQCDDNPQLLLQRVYEERSAVMEDTTSASRIASVCKTVFEMAFPVSSGSQAQTQADPDEKARAIVVGTANDVASLVQMLLDDKVVASESALVLGGSLYRNQQFVELVTQTLVIRGITFRTVQAHKDAGVAAALVLANEVL